MHAHRELNATLHSRRLTPGGWGQRPSPVLLGGCALALLAAAEACLLLHGAARLGALALTQIPGALALIYVTSAQRRARSRAVRAAALGERRRVARDLHDGLAQDLAFIAAYGPALCAQLGDDHPLVVAARRALTIARGTIDELSDPAQATTAEALDAVAQELGDRFEIAVAVEVALRGELAPGAREQISRISREAIANAARHGGARRVRVSLVADGRDAALRVTDDGRGLAGGELSEGFGLQSMRESAAALGGQLSVGRARHGGTALEVRFR